MNSKLIYYQRNRFTDAIQILMDHNSQYKYEQISELMQRFNIELMIFEMIYVNLKKNNNKEYKKLLIDFLLKK
jgi:hypothetical protein